MKQRVLSGIQPSGNITIGNYLGAIRNWVPYQETHDCYFVIVDAHAITVPQNPAELKRSTLLAAAAYMACGINPQKSTLFVQSTVHEHTELAWYLNCQTPIGWLNRMTQFKDKAGKNKEKASLGLYAYPVLMASDILLYEPEYVPVGEDQKQHLELTRDIASSFNVKYGETFIIPQPMIMEEGARVMSLRDGTAKMSKSDPSDFARINLTDGNDAIAQKIKKAKTDPHPLPSLSDDLSERPEAKNLLTIYALFSGKSYAEAVSEFEGQQFSMLKNALTEALIAGITPIREGINRYMQNEDYLMEQLKVGQRAAQRQAQLTVRKVKDRLGIVDLT